MLPLAQRFKLRAIEALPSIMAVLLALLYLAPKPFEGLESVTPLLPLIPIFYWGVSVGRVTPYGVALCIGLAVDAAQGTPLGLSSLLYMLLVHMTRAQHRLLHKAGFLPKWASFAVLMLTLTVANWLLLSWFYARPMPWISAAIQWGMTVGCYPLLHKIFDKTEQYFHARRWHILHGK